MSGFLIGAGPHRHRRGPWFHGGEARHRCCAQQPRLLRVSLRHSLRTRKKGIKYPIAFRALIIEGGPPSLIPASQRDRAGCQVHARPRCTVETLKRHPRQRKCRPRSGPAEYESSVWNTPSPRLRLASTILAAGISRSCPRGDRASPFSSQLMPESPWAPLTCRRAKSRDRGEER